MDRYVDDIAYTFGVDRQALNVVGMERSERIVLIGSRLLLRKDW